MFHIPFILGGAMRAGVEGKVDAAGADVRAQRAEWQAQDLAREVDRLSMLTEALWEIVKEREGLDDDALRERVTVIDARRSTAAGHPDAYLARPCAACGRPLSRRHERCIYCSAERLRGLFGR